MFVLICDLRDYNMDALIKPRDKIITNIKIINAEPVKNSVVDEVHRSINDNLVYETDQYDEEENHYIQSA